MSATPNPSAGGNVIEFEGLQIHRVHVGGGEHLILGGIELSQVRPADKALEHRYVRRVCVDQGEAGREDPGEQTCVVGGGMLEHGGVRLQQDVNGKQCGKNGNTVFQSLFMLTTVQPSFFACSSSAGGNAPSLTSGSPRAGP